MGFFVYFFSRTLRKIGMVNFLRSGSSQKLLEKFGIEGIVKKYLII